MLIIGVRNKSLSIYLTYDKINPHLSTGRNHVEKKKIFELFEVSKYRIALIPNPKRKKIFS